MSVESVKTCYLIGGAPLSGKTTLSNLWAKKYHATQLSTDSIRAWMREIGRREDYPRLFTGSGKELSADEFYEMYDTAQKVLGQQVDETQDVIKGIKAFLECGLTMDRLIIEGIAITPESAITLQQAFPHIAFEVTFLVDDNLDRITKRIKERGLWGPAASYPDYIKPKEVEWVILYNNFYRAEAAKHNFPVLHIDELEGAS